MGLLVRRARVRTVAAARESRRWRGLAASIAFAAVAALLLSEPRLAQDESSPAFLSPAGPTRLVRPGRSSNRLPAAWGEPQWGSHRGMLAALRAEGLTVEELKARLREKPFGNSGKASRIGRMLADFVGHLEKAMEEDITEEEEQVLSQDMEQAFGSTDAVVEGTVQPHKASFSDAESMLAQLMTLDDRVSKEDYFDEAGGTWDIEGLRSDLDLAKERPQQQQEVAPLPPPPPPAQQQRHQEAGSLPPPPPPPPQEMSAVSPAQPSSDALAEQQFAELSKLDSRVSREDYFDGDQWDVEGLEDDLQLARERSPPPADVADESPSAPAANAQAGVVAAPITIGDAVLAHFVEDGNWYAAKVTGAEGDHSFKIKWDEDDSDSVVAKDDMKPLPPLEVGSQVRAIWAEDGGWYFGKVTAEVGGGRYTVKYDEDESDATLNADAIRPYEEPPQMWAAPFEEGSPAPKAGERAEALWKDGDFEGYYGVVVQKDNGDGSFTVKWDEDSSESSVQRAELRIMRPRVPSDSLKHGQKMKAVVVKVMEFGAFVDAGAEGNGLVHRSKLSDNFVANLEDVVWEGKEVDVWFIGKNPRDQLDFSMSANKLAPSAQTGGPRPIRDISGFKGVDASVWLPAKVVNIMAFGAFVEVAPPGGGAPQTGMVHITQLTDGFVEKAEDVVQIGQDVQVRVIDVDTTQNKLGLSMKQE